MPVEAESERKCSVGEADGRPATVDSGIAPGRSALGAEVGIFELRSRPDRDVMGPAPVGTGRAAIPRAPKARLR